MGFNSGFKGLILWYQES